MADGRCSFCSWTIVMAFYVSFYVKNCIYRGCEMRRECIEWCAKLVNSCACGKGIVGVVCGK